MHHFCDFVKPAQFSCGTVRTHRYMPPLADGKAPTGQWEAPKGEGKQACRGREHYEAQVFWLGAVVCTTACGQLACFSHTASRLPGVVVYLENSMFSMLRPYHPEHTPCRPIREVKLDWAQPVLG